MDQRVKRKYNSNRRQEQARQTRREILRAAHDLFIDSGYGSTTMNDIAGAAGVAVETVYAAFGNKANLLRKVWDVAIGGDDQDIEFRDRPEVVRLREGKDVPTRLEMFASLYALEIAPRTAPFMRAVRGAAASNPEARDVQDEMDRQRLTGLTAILRELVAGEGLAVSEDEARDVLWASTSSDLWQLLVLERGWDPDRFGRWLGDFWKRMLVSGRT